MTEPPAGSLGVSYLVGTTWRRPDGSTVELGARYGGGTKLGDDLLAVRNDDGRLTVDVIAPDGTVSDSFGTVTYPVANAEHTTLAYVTADRSLITRWADGEGALAEGLDGDDTVAAVVGGPDCTEGDGCRVVLNHGDLRPAEVLDSRDNRAKVVPPAVKVSDATPGGWSPPSSPPATPARAAPCTARWQPPAPSIRASTPSTTSRPAAATSAGPTPTVTDSGRRG